MVPVPGSTRGYVISCIVDYFTWSQKLLYLVLQVVVLYLVLFSRLAGGNIFALEFNFYSKSPLNNLKSVEKDLADALFLQCSTLALGLWAWPYWLLYLILLDIIPRPIGYYTLSYWLLYLVLVVIILDGVVVISRPSGNYTLSQWLLYLVLVFIIPGPSVFYTWTQWLLYLLLVVPEFGGKQK